MKWSLEQEEKLISFYNDKEHLSYMDIAKKMNKSLDAVKHKIRRLVILGKIKERMKNLSIEDRINNVKQYLYTKKEKNLLSNAVKRRAATEILIEAVKDSIERLPKLKIKDTLLKKTTRIYKEEEANLVISDVHIGEKITYEETGGLAAYSKDIFLKEFEILKKSIENITLIHRKAYPMNKINIFFLGDIATGELIYKGQRSYVDLDCLEQMFLAAQKFSELLIFCNRLYPNVNVYCIHGNHGRMTQEKDILKPYISWDTIIYHFMKEKLINNPQIKFEIPTAWWQLVNVKGWDILSFHGSDIKSYMGLPYYSYEKLESRWLRMLRDIGKSFHYCLIAHFHNMAAIGSGSGERIINGSWVPASILSLKKMGVGNRPQQLFFGMDETHGITWRYNLNLTEEK